MGSLVKDYFANLHGQTPDNIYHVAVMPCFDKKLEASRQDFYNDMYRTRDVDCVITSGGFYNKCRLTKMYKRIRQLMVDRIVLSIYKR